MGANPFKHRWNSDDPDFLKQRKRQWHFVKYHYVNRCLSAKELNKLKIFFLVGDWPDGIMPDTGPFLGWTPSKDVSDVQELLKYLSVQSRGKDYIKMAHSYASYGGGLRVTSDSPVSFFLGNEALLSKVMLGDKYTEELQLSSDGLEIFPRHMAPQEFISSYENFSHGLLVSVDPDTYSPLKYSLEFYLSCINYLEGRGQEVKHHVNFPIMLSAAFNFVEGGQVEEKPSSTIAEFAELLRERLTKPDISIVIKQVIKELGPKRLIEYSRKQPLEGEVYVHDNYKSASSPWVAPYAKVMRGCEHKVAIVSFWQAALRAELIPCNTQIPDIYPVEIGALLSNSLVKELGYSKGEPVPAYRFTLWYQPTVCIANHEEAEFGADLILPLSKNGIINETTASVIYYPRLNSYFKDWIPTTVLFLKERQVRRAIFEQTHIHLLDYCDDWSQPLTDNFMNSPYLEVGFEVFRNENEGDINHSISGPDTPPWQGEPLPELNLKAMLINDDSQ